MRLVQLMFRASVMRVTAVVIAIASALLMLAASTVTSLSLTPEQLADRELGSADMSIQLPTTLASGAGLSPNRAFEAIVQEAGGTGLRYSLSVPAIPVAGEGNLYQFIETAWELRPFPHRYNLVDGRWPSRPGEVVLVERHQGRVGRLELFGGVTSVAVVGRATDLFAEANHEILASPGTWASFHSEVSQRFPTTVANVTVYWNGSRPPALSALARPWLASISEDGSQLCDPSAIYRCID